MILEEVKKGTYKLKEGQYLQKVKDKYRVIYPIKKDITKKFKKGNIDWKNFILGDVTQTVIMTILIISLMVVVIDYKSTVERCEDLVKDPCGYCAKINSPIYLPSNSFNKLNLTETKGGGLSEEEVDIITGNTP